MVKTEEKRYYFEKKNYEKTLTSITGNTALVFLLISFQNEI